MWKINPKINMYTKTSIIIYKLKVRTFLLTVELLYGTWGKRGRKKE
jgi:hypothetical protein